MCAIVAVFFVIATTLQGVCGTRVDSAVVRGRLDDVSIADIREAIATTTNATKTASEVDIINSNEIHIYLGSRELGWIPVRRHVIQYPTGRKRQWVNEETQIICERPDVMELINSAERVYIFPVKFKPNTYFVPYRVSPLRLLGPKARRELGHLLGREKNWFHGGDERIVLDHSATNVGFLFRKGKDKLVLFLSIGTAVQGAINDGPHAGGNLEDRALEAVEGWKQRYAQPELLPVGPNHAL